MPVLDTTTNPEAATHAAKHRTSYFLVHGKETTDRSEVSSRDINRLRIYFDSPAGQGPGEKRGRGGIEGHRANPNVPKKGAAAANRATQAAAAAVSAETSSPSLTATLTTALGTDEKPKDKPDSTAAEEKLNETVDEEELDGEPMEDNLVHPAGAKDEDATAVDGEDLVEELVTEGVEDLEEADTTKPTPLAVDPDVYSAFAELLSSPPDSTFTSVDHPTTMNDTSIAATTLDRPDDAEDAGDVSMTSARSLGELATASLPSVEDGITISQAADSNQATIDQIASTDTPANEEMPIPADASGVETAPSAPVSSDHPLEPPTSPRKPHPYTTNPVENLRSPSPTTSHLATEHPIPTAPSATPSAVSTVPHTPASGVTTHVAPTAQELRDEKSFPIYTGPEPSPNRVSILYQQCSRRLCIDAEVVERVRVSRAEGKVEFTIRWRKGEKEGASAVVKSATPAGPSAATAVEASAEEAVAVKQEVKEDPAIKIEALDEDEGDRLDEKRATSPMKISSPVKTQQETTAIPPSTQAESKAPSSVPPTGPSKAAAPQQIGGSQSPVDNRTWDICRGFLVSAVFALSTTYLWDEADPLMPSGVSCPLFLSDGGA